MAVLLARPSASWRLRAALRSEATRAGIGRAPPRVGALVGVEHEFVVRLDGSPIDFRQVIHRLAIPGRRIDVSDPNAYRGPWGGTITADGREAEIATPPVTVGPMAGRRLAAVAADGASRLRQALPAGAMLEGYSTHISVQVPPGCEERAVLHLAERYAPALTWLLDGPESPGLLVRPRPGRVEVGGDYVHGERLALAAVFAVGAVRAAVRSTSRAAGSARVLRTGRHAGDAPPRLAVTPSPAVARYGWFIGDTELGAALHQHGGSTSLQLADAGAITFGDHLRQCWIAVLAELGDVEREIVGRLGALVSSVPLWPTATITEAHQPAPDVASDPSLRAWVAANREHVRPGFIATPILMSWDVAVLRVRGGGREAIVSLPRDVLGGALLALESGCLDLLLGGYLASSHGDGRLLASSRQISTAGLFRGVAKGADLAIPERQPDGGGKDRRREDDRRDQPDDRRGQPEDRPDPSSSAGATATAAALAASVSGRPATPAVSASGGAATARSRPLGAIAVVAGVVVLALVAGWLVLGGGSGSPRQALIPGASAPGEASAAPTPPSAPPSVAPSVAAIDVNVDVCALLDTATIEQLTGESGRFLADDFRSRNCFWGSVQGGVPAYVDLTVQPSSGLNSPWIVNGQPCTVTLTEGVGEEADGGTCLVNSQTRVYVRAVERGASVELYVNEPGRPLAPTDLVPVVESILAQLR